ncbi:MULTISPECIES: LPS export ABC transporter periplasmic protein LptC [Rhodonellum]|nr:MULTISPECIES: LPS export ABC transporter periplasmic protein LptC [Rhodonellum]MDO9552747.1 LPS export ABC transporter periplasmic protein LptC [Rhodonellum sp.]
MKPLYHMLAMLTIFQFLLVSCGPETDTALLEVYQGPTSIGYDIDLVHSDSAIIRTNLKAKKQLEFGTGDIEFPEGIEISIFGRDGELTTTMRADRGYFIRKDNLYRGEGDVQVHNLEKNQKLSSEELFWDPNTKKIYTDKFVTIQEQETLINGTGMEADEGFNEYKLFKVTNSRMLLPGEGF